ncbi:MAG TPA: hypothetical protein EYQ68_04075 [Cytophagales bacterium]|nr:hypothetical protein [Cytophagales bacterium]
MIRILVLIFFSYFLIQYYSFSQDYLKNYKIDGIDNMVQNHKNIAILPFKFKIIQKEKSRKKLTPKQLMNEEYSLSLGTTATLFRYLYSKPKKLLVNVQPPNNTIRLLSQSGIDLSEIESVSKKKLCEILGVDAIVIGTFINSRTIAKGLGSISLMGFSVENKNDIKVEIFDSRDKLLWRYSRKMSGNDVNAVIYESMGFIGKRFPYLK